MHFLLFTTAIASLFGLAEPSLLPIKVAEQLFSYNNTAPSLAIKNNPNRGLSGTYRINYQFPIGDLLISPKSVIFDILTPDVCVRSEMLQEYCDVMRKTMKRLDEDEEVPIEKLRRLHTIAYSERSRLVRLENLPDDMQGDVKSDFLEVLNEQDEQYNQQIRETVERIIGDILEESNGDGEKDLAPYLYDTMEFISMQRHTRLAIIEETVSKCQHNDLPMRIISFKAVLNDLKKAERTLNESGFELSTPVLKLFVLPLAECHVVNDQLHVSLSVPVHPSSPLPHQNAHLLPHQRKPSQNKPVGPNKNKSETISVVEKFKADLKKIGGFIYKLAQVQI